MEATSASPALVMQDAAREWSASVYGQYYNTQGIGLPDLTLRHAVDDHTHGCGGRTYSCECGYDSKTERLLRAAASRIEELEARLRGIRERRALNREGEQE